MKMLPLVLALGVLAGCAPIRGDHTPLEPQSVQRLDLTETAVQWPDTHWWTRYGDAQLDRLVEDALRENPTLDVAQARLDQALAATGTARSALLPDVSANYSLSRQRRSENYTYPPPLAGSVGTDQRLALDFSYELDFWGKNRHALQAAVSRARAAEAEQQAARTLLAYSMVQAYLELQGAFAQQAVLQDVLAQRRQVVDLTQDRLKNGLDTQVETEQARSAAAQAEVQLTQTRTRIAQLRNRVAALAGQGPSRAAALGAVTLTRPAGQIPEQLPLALLGRRPDVVAARWRVQATDRDVDVARTLFYPNVNLTAFLGLQALGLHNLIEAGSKTAGVGPAITLPIFQGGALNANLDGRVAARNEAQADYNTRVLDAVHQVADALDALRMIDTERRAQTEARRAIDAAYRLALDRYKGGLGNYLTVLVAQDAVMTQAQRDTELHTRAYLLDADLARALGGGYDASLFEHETETL